MGRSHVGISGIGFCRLRFLGCPAFFNGRDCSLGSTVNPRFQVRNLCVLNCTKRSGNKTDEYRSPDTGTRSARLTSILLSVAISAHSILIIGATIAAIFSVHVQAYQCKSSSAELSSALEASVAWLEQNDALAKGDPASGIERQIAMLLAQEQLRNRAPSTLEVQTLSIRAIEARNTLSSRDLSWLAPLAWLAHRYCPVICESRKLQTILSEIVLLLEVLDPLGTVWVYGLAGLDKQQRFIPACIKVARNADVHAKVYKVFRAYGYAITHSVFALTQFGTKQTHLSTRLCAELLLTPTRRVLARAELAGDLDLYAEAIAASSYLRLAGVDWSAIATRLLAQQQYDGSFLPPILYGPDFAYEHYHASAAATLALTSLHHSLPPGDFCLCNENCGGGAQKQQFQRIHSFDVSEESFTMYRPWRLSLPTTWPDTSTQQGNSGVTYGA